MDEAKKKSVHQTHFDTANYSKEFLMNYFKNSPCFKEDYFFCPALNEVIYYIMRLV